MSEHKSPTSILPKLIAVTICAFIVVISNIPPRFPDQNVKLQIERTVPNKFSLRYLFENVMAVALPSQNQSAGYTQWYGVLSMLLVPYCVPFLVRLLRERHQNGLRRYAQWTMLDRLSATAIILGSGLRLWAFRCLGEYFTFNITIKEDQPLLRTGPYKVLIF
jgi:protein-S-isoprenylcysteine O-methyltransferase Ste14